MDNITHAALGAAVGEVILGKKLGNKAAILGAVIANIPDLDMLFVPFFDEVTQIGVHRGYSHSLLFCLLAALLFAYILNRIKWTALIPFRRLWLFSFVALLSHVLLDAFTSFGTQLFQPFTDWRVSLDAVNIIDLAYTLPLLTGVLLNLFLYKPTDKRRGFFNNLALIISSLYLVFTLANKQHIVDVFESELEAQNIPSFRLLTVPVGSGNLTWHGVAKDKTNLYIGKYSLLDPKKVEFHSFPINEQLLTGLDQRLVNRMKWYSKGYYTVAKKDDKIRLYNMQCDMQGIRHYGDYKAPTAFYFEITPHQDNSFDLTEGMHPAEGSD